MRAVNLILLGAVACASQPPATVDVPTVPEPAPTPPTSPASSGTAAPAEPVSGAEGPVDAMADPTATNGAGVSSADEVDASIAGILQAMGGLRVDAGVVFGSGSLGTGFGSGSMGLGGVRGYGGLGSGAGASVALADAGTIASGDAGAGLSKEQIRRVVVSHTGSLRACYEIEAQKNDKL